MTTNTGVETRELADAQHRKATRPKRSAGRNNKTVSIAAAVFMALMMLAGVFAPDAAAAWGPDGQKYQRTSDRRCAFTLTTGEIPHMNAHMSGMLTAGFCHEVFMEISLTDAYGRLLPTRYVDLDDDQVGIWHSHLVTGPYQVILVKACATSQLNGDKACAYIS